MCACSSHESYGSQSFLMILKIRWLPICVAPSSYRSLEGSLPSYES